MELEVRIHTIKKTWSLNTIFFDDLMKDTEIGKYPWEPYHMNVKDYFELILTRWS